MKQITILIFLITLGLGTTAQTSPATKAPLCKAITVSGSQCTRKAKDNGYCWQHNPTAIHCKGTTKKGVPCKRLAMKGSLYCFQHKS